MITVSDAREIVLALLAVRATEATVCPSEVARSLAAAGGAQLKTSEDWRGAMPVVHAAIDGLLADGLVLLSWKGESLTKRVGPYRIGHSAGE